MISGPFGCPRLNRIYFKLIARLLTLCRVHGNLDGNLYKNLDKNLDESLAHNQAFLKGEYDMINMVVFTDLDGTLLDHQTYAYTAAQPALEALKLRHIPLVLASSKTAAEIATLHSQLDLGATPAIVENGAGIYTPCVDPVSMDVTPYQRIRKILDQLEAHLCRHFVGFSDMSVAQIAQISGLPEKLAKSAKQRVFSEPGIWQGSSDALNLFIAALEMHNIAVKQGGRFLTLSFGATKADQMQAISDRLNAHMSVALGDAPNDIEMLERADRSIIVRNDHGVPIPFLPGEATGHIIRTTYPGPKGWNRAVLDILAELDKGWGKI